MTILKVTRVTRENFDSIVSLIVLSFATDPVMRWMYPSAQQYLDNFPDFVKTFANKAFDFETVYSLEGYPGVAIWFPPNTKPDSDSVGAFIQQTVSLQQQEEIFAMFGDMERYHPNEPHWYLAVLGVDPFHQKKGYGAALLNYQLSLCDRNQQIAYLESSSLEQVSFYEKYGFKCIATIQVGDSPTIFPMVRHPH